MSLTGKSFLFYSEYPKDELSKFAMELARKYNMSGLFYFYCVNRHKFTPTIIRQINRLPVIISNGFDKPIVGTQVIKWLKTHAETTGQLEGRDSLTYVDIGKLGTESQIFCDINEEFKTNGTNIMAISDMKGVDNTLHSYAKLNEKTCIETIDDGRKLKDSELNERLEKYNAVRHDDMRKDKLYNPTTMDKGDVEEMMALRQPQNSVQPENIYCSKRMPAMPTIGMTGGIGMGGRTDTISCHTKPLDYDSTLMKRNFITPPSMNSTSSPVNTRDMFNTSRRGFM